MTADAGFGSVYENEYHVVYRAAWVACGDRAAAEDATQEAFARALERWSRIGNQPWVVGWIVTTALRLARRRRVIRVITETSDPLDTDLSLDVWRGIRALSRRQQQVVLLYYVADLPVAQVAAALGCGQGTVKAHLSRARKALRPYVETEHETGRRAG